MTVSAVFIVPAHLRAAADAFCVSMGWQEPASDSPVFVSRLTSNGTTLTHYGCRPDLTPELEAMLADPPTSAAGLIAAMIIDVSTTGEFGWAHYGRVLAEHGLSILEG
jgi:hypothetical protein